MQEIFKHQTSTKFSQAAIEKQKASGGGASPLLSELPQSRIDSGREMKCS